MGYKVKKLRAETKVRRAKYILFAVVFAFVAALCIVSAIYPAASWKYYFGLPETGNRKEGQLRVHFLDVGQGDATILEFPDGKTALIDGGPSDGDSVKSLMRYLNALNVDEIDFLVATHCDDDHCGGLVEALKYKKVKRAYLPAGVSATVSESYAAFYEAVVAEKCEVVYASRSTNAIVGETYPYELHFLHPYTLDVEEGEAGENENSIVTWLDYEGVSALFCGDIDETTELALKRDYELGTLDRKGVALNETEILKVAHHGSAYSSCEEFLSVLNVKDAVISCGKGNAYGHPSERVLSSLAGVGANVYRTDEAGHILATIAADGKYTIDKLN